MVYAILSAGFVLQTVFFKLMLDNMRSKMYIDMMDFVIERRRKESRRAEEEQQSGRSHLKIVKNNDG